MERKVRTTVALPQGLLEDVDRAVREGRARSRNELLSVALKREISAMERARIDEASGFMAEDPAYGEEAEKIAEEFEAASREALRSVKD